MSFTGVAARPAGRRASPVEQGRRATLAAGSRGELGVESLSARVPYLRRDGRVGGSVRRTGSDGAVATPAPTAWSPPSRVDSDRVILVHDLFYGTRASAADFDQHATSVCLLIGLMALNAGANVPSSGCGGWILPFYTCCRMGGFVGVHLVDSQRRFGDAGTVRNLLGLPAVRGGVGMESVADEQVGRVRHYASPFSKESRKSVTSRNRSAERPEPPRRARR